MWDYIFSLSILKIHWLICQLIRAPVTSTILITQVYSGIWKCCSYASLWPGSAIFSSVLTLQETTGISVATYIGLKLQLLLLSVTSLWHTVTSLWHTVAWETSVTSLRNCGCTYCSPPFRMTVAYLCSKKEHFGHLLIQWSPVSSRLLSHQNFSSHVPSFLVLCSSNHPMNKPGEPTCSKPTTCRSGEVLVGMSSSAGNRGGRYITQDGSVHAKQIVLHVHVWCQVLPFLYC